MASIGKRVCPTFGRTARRVRRNRRPPRRRVGKSHTGLLAHATAIIAAVSLHSLAILAARLIPTGTRLPVLTGPLRGSKWIAGAAAGDGKGLSALFNRLEREQVELAAALTRKDGVCLDIGANVGLYTLLFARRGRHVYAFEPLPRNVALLARLVEVNRLANVTIVPAAVAARTTLTSFTPGDNHALGRIDPDGQQPVLTVSCDELVDALRLAPAIVKIDVEGAELAVLDGARRMLREHRPALLLSVHSDYLRGQCMAFLESLGYRYVLPLGAPQVSAASELAFLANAPSVHGARAWLPLTAERNSRATAPSGSGVGTTTTDPTLS